MEFMLNQTETMEQSSFISQSLCQSETDESSFYSSKETMPELSFYGPDSEENISTSACTDPPSNISFCGSIDPEPVCSEFECEDVNLDSNNNEILNDTITCEPCTTLQVQIPDQDPKELEIFTQCIETILNVRVFIKRLSFNDIEALKQKVAKTSRPMLKTVHLKKKTLPNVSRRRQSGESSRANANARIYKCPNCPCSYSWYKSLTAHLQKNKCFDRKERKTIKCPKCHMGFLNEISLNKHLETHKDSISTDIASSCMSGSKVRLSHKCISKFLLNQVWHQKLNKKRCQGCGMYYTNTSSLKAHKNSGLCTFSQRLVCPICYKTVANSSFKIHIRAHFKGSQSNNFVPKMLLSNGELDMKEVVKILNDRMQS